MKKISRFEFLVKFSLVVFLIYTAIIFINTYLPTLAFSYLRVLLGIMIFFVAGINLALVFEKISKVSLDLWEFMTVGFFIALLIDPLIVYTFFKISGFVSKTSIILIYLTISLISLIFYYYIQKRNEI